MPDSETVKICDPLYDYIYLDREEKSLISHPVFQRLRAIRQLGFSEQAFPSATHNRFSHSLGVCHLAGQAFDSIFSKNNSLLNPGKKRLFRRTLRAASLLHDIGHGPLSHSSESLLPPLKDLRLQKLLREGEGRSARHEDYSLCLIMEEEGLCKLIKEAGLEPEAVARLLHPGFSGGEGFFVEKGLNFLPLLRQILSSDFDVDRMDYLYRDSLSCGVKYGLIDFIWLISHFNCHIEGGQVFLAVNREALYTLESLILGRQHMRLIVYFHHKSAIYNQMLKNYAKNCDWKLPSDLAEYISWTDHLLFEKLKSSKDVWARRITEQRPYLRLYESIFFENSSEPSPQIKSLRERLKGERVGFIHINSEKHSIKPHKSASQNHPIYLKNKALNQAQALSENPALLSIPSRRIERVYVDPSVMGRAKSCLNNLPGLKAGS